MNQTWMGVVVSLAFVLCSTVPALAETVSGPARVLDFRTLKVDGSKLVNLKWIAAPWSYRIENTHPALWVPSPSRGDAAEALRMRIGKATVTCEVVEHRRFQNFRIKKYFRGTCYLRTPTGRVDLNGWLVRHGWARVNRLLPKKRYVAEEREAKTQEIGFWFYRKRYRWCCGGRLSPPMQRWTTSISSLMREE